MSWKTTFTGKIAVLERWARDTAVRSRQTYDQASADRVSAREDNRDDRRHPLGENTCGSAANNDIDVLPDELGNDLGCALAASLRPSNLDGGGAPLDPTDCM